MDADERRKPRKNDRIPVTLMCQVLNVSRSGYNAWKKRAPSLRAREDERLKRLIAGLHEHHKGRIGIERMVVELAKAGHHHSPKRVRRLTREMGLECVHPRPYKATTIQDETNTRGLIDLVKRDFVPEAANQLWYTDITYIHTWTGWAYLAAIIDGHTRKIVGWSVANHMRTELVTDALRMAITNQQPEIGECIIHSDRGSQFTGDTFRDLAFDNGILPSVGHTGVCYDNAMIESFNATVKKELIHLQSWPTLTHLRSALFEYIEIYYNRQRPHSGIDYMTPAEKEQQSLGKLDSGTIEAA